MKWIKQQTRLIQVGLISLACNLIATDAFANDLFAKALQGDVADSLGSGAMFWKAFILVDIILATAVAIKTKNPMAFVGTAAVAFIPAYLVKTFVF